MPGQQRNSIAEVKDCRISDSTEDVDFEFVHQYLARESIWAQGIDVDVLARAIENSLCISAHAGDQQIAFARVVTDCATYAWIDDFFVHESARGRGIGYRVIEAIANHPRLETVRFWWLASSNPVARSLFRKFGFDEPDSTRVAKLMTRPKPN